jgi:plasmid stability protein
MASITIKDIPEDLLERLRHRAAEDRRSMNREIIHLLNLALSSNPADRDAADMARRIDAQIRAWRQLAGRWESDLDAAEEIEDIYAARSGGRQVDW